MVMKARFTAVCCDVQCLVAVLPERHLKCLFLPPFQNTGGQGLLNSVASVMKQDELPPA